MIWLTTGFLGRRSSQADLNEKNLSLKSTRNTGYRRRAHLSQKLFTQIQQGYRIQDATQGQIWVKNFSLKSSRGRGCTFELKLVLDYRVQGKEKRRGRPLFLFLLGSTFFFRSISRTCNAPCRTIIYSSYKGWLRHFTLNPNGYRTTTMMTMRGKTFCKEEKSGLGNSWGVILSNLLNLGRVGDLVIWWPVCSENFNFFI